MAALSQPVAAHRMRDIRCNNKPSVPPPPPPPPPPPLQLDAIYSPSPDLPSGKKGRKKEETVTQKKRALASRQRLVEETEPDRNDARAALSPSSRGREQRGTFPLRVVDWLKFIHASCSSCAKKLGIYASALLFFMRKKKKRTGWILPTASPTETSA